MKEKLIDTLFEEFEKDKEIIKKNIMWCMDSVWLQTSNDYGNLSLIVKYERKEENEDIK